MEEGFKQFLQRPKNRAVLEEHQRKEARRAEKLADRQQALDFRAKVLETEYSAQRNVAPFLKVPVLRRIVQTFTNDEHDDFGRWADNPLVLQMLGQAKALLDEGRMSEPEMEALLLAQLASPAFAAPPGGDAATARTVRLAAEQLVPALNEHLEERRLGNEHYRAGRPAAALRHYERARGIVELVRGLAPADQAEVDRNRVAVALNAAAAHLALHQYADAVRLCSAALELDGSNETALRRRGKALSQMHEYAAARRDLAALAALGPAAEGAAAEALRELGAAQARGQAAERQAFQGMFHRPSELEPHRQ